jgi:putative cobalt transporter subunit CbtB
MGTHDPRGGPDGRSFHSRQSQNPSIPGSTTKPAARPVSKGLLWLLGATLFAVAVYYFIGVDQSATSVFGKSMVIHEFVHDARHFLGFPCH